MKQGWYILGADSDWTHKQIVECLKKEAKRVTVGQRAACMNIDSLGCLAFPSLGNTTVYFYYTGTEFTQYLRVLKKTRKGVAYEVVTFKPEERK